jgi:hypothetical protein
MKTNHTPGEWMTEYCGKDTIKVFKTSDKRRIATVKVKHMLMDEANAALIAAAPDMLRALQDAYNLLDIARRYFPKSIQNSDKFTLENTMENSVKKAIRKANGDA